MNIDDCTDWSSNDDNDDKLQFDDEDAKQQVQLDDDAQQQVQLDEDAKQQAQFDEDELEFCEYKNKLPFERKVKDNDFYPNVPSIIFPDNDIHKFKKKTGRVIRKLIQEKIKKQKNAYNDNQISNCNLLSQNKNIITKFNSKKINIAINNNS